MRLPPCSPLPACTRVQEEMVPIRVSVRAVFSRYSITPARGINFGPLTYNTTSKPRSFEITNLGAWHALSVCVHPTSTLSC